MHPRASRLVLALIGAVLLSTSACGTPPPAPLEQSDRPVVSPSASDPGPYADDVELDWTFSGINALATDADAVVLGTVVREGPVLWNSPDGLRWSIEDDPGSPAAPLQYKDVDLVVQRDLSAPATYSAGETVTVRLFGNGRHSGPPVAFGVRYDEAYGVATQGDTVLVLLASETQVMADGSTADIRRPVGGYQSAWTVRGQRAVSLDPMRTVDLAALEERIVAERAAGRDHDQSPEVAELTIRDPLAGAPG